MILEFINRFKREVILKSLKLIIRFLEIIQLNNFISIKDFEKVNKININAFIHI